MRLHLTMASLTPQTAIPQAQGLVSAGLQSRILSPTDAEFTARQESYWSNSAKITPACIVQPQSAEEVAIADKALVAAGQKFAVRSGGHTNWAGSNNIKDGVTIDLVRLNKTVYNADTETASIGPGCRWREVYAELDKHGRAAAGGRHVVGALEVHAHRAAALRCADGGEHRRAHRACRELTAVPAARVARLHLHRVVRQ